MSPACPSAVGPRARKQLLTEGRDAEAKVKAPCGLQVPEHYYERSVHSGNGRKGGKRSSGMCKCMYEHGRLDHVGWQMKTVRGRLIEVLGDSDADAETKAAWRHKIKVGAKCRQGLRDAASSQP